MRRPILLAGLGLLLVTALALVAIGLVAPSDPAPSPTAFADGPENMSAWAGTLAASSHPLHPILADTALADQADSREEALLVLVDPDPIDPQHAGLLDEHLERGGSLLVLDPAGNLNPWLNQHGLAVTNRTVLDARSEDATHVGTMGTLAGETFEPVEDVSPSALSFDEGSAWSVTRSAPAQTFLDLDGDGEIDRTDRPGPHPIEAIRDVEDGVLVVAASSMLANDAYETASAENEAYVQALTEHLIDPGGPVLISEADHGWTQAEAPVAASVQQADTLHRAGPLATGLLLAVLAVLCLASVRTASTLEPYPPHEVDTEPVEPSTVPQDPELVEQLAWQTASRALERPVEGLKADGVDTVRDAFALDDAFERAFRGQATAEDAETIASRYESVTNHE